MENKEKKENASAQSLSESDSSLQALVEEEQSVARQNLQQELGREPTQEEVDRWLSEQTEGY